jgi:hypothetical protein
MTASDQPRPAKRRPVEQIAQHTYCRSVPQPQASVQKAWDSSQYIGTGPLIGPRSGQHLEPAAFCTDEENRQERPQGWQRAPSLPIMLPEADSRRATSSSSLADVEEDDLEEPPRLPNSVRRYHQVPQQRSITGDVPVRGGSLNIIVQRRSRRPARLPPPPHEEEYEPGMAPAGDPGGFHPHWLLLVGIGMLVTLLLWVAGMSVVQQARSLLATWRYGIPRTAQYDAVVGHADSRAHPSHFIAVNLNGQVWVFELPGGDGTHARIYLGPHLPPGEALEPVTLQFRDLSGDKKPDMVILVDGQPVMVYLNTTVKGVPAFRPATVEDHLHW